MVVSTRIEQVESEDGDNVQLEESHRIGLVL